MAAGVPNGARVMIDVSPRAVRGLLAAAALLACSAQSPAPLTELLPWCTTIPLPRPDTMTLRSDVDSQTIHTPKAETCRVLVVRGIGTTLRLAVAATEAQREHGLMGVPYVPQGQGMIFVFSGNDERRGFWMKDTIASLDMIFVKADGIISSVAANVPATKPGTPDDQVARRDGVARYVIELGAGEAARLRLTPGSRLVVPLVDAR